MPVRIEPLKLGDPEDNKKMQAALEKALAGVITSGDWRVSVIPGDRTTWKAQIDGVKWKQGYESTTSPELIAQEISPTLTTGVGNHEK